MKQSTKIQGIITDINLLDWHDDMHELFSKAQDALEDLLIGLERFEENTASDGGRDTQQEVADWRASR